MTINGEAMAEILFTKNSITSKNKISQSNTIANNVPMMIGPKSHFFMFMPYFGTLETFYFNNKNVINFFD